MSKEKLSKAELVKIAKDHGYFKRPKVEIMWGRENGHFYYTTPPAFTDGLESYKITREDVEGKSTSKKETPKKEESKK